MLPADAPAEFSVYQQGHEVWRGLAGSVRFSTIAGQAVRVADFSDWCLVGCYTLKAGPWECDFTVAEHPYLEVAAALLKGFYYQRASLELLPSYAGNWARPLGHPDLEVIVHPSAASAQRPAGTKVASPGGWYDAGDYNKYIVNSGITTATLLASCEDFEHWAGALRVNIPDSGSGLPDVLAEARWNIDWMLTMQDPNDGGVYHKLTNLRFDGMVLPHECHEPRFVVQKTTAASLDFAAVCAQASRVYNKYDPDFASRCLSCAQTAYEWAAKHPEVYYKQPDDVFTGAYGDTDATDEFYWAEMALYNATHNEQWLSQARARTPRLGVPSWQSVGTLGLLELLRVHPQSVPERELLLHEANTLLVALSEEAFAVSMRTQDFEWGSNAVAANQGMVLLNAYRLTQDERYYHAAVQLWDYLLGRNPTGYCFVSGFGTHSPLDLHHRPSQGDTVRDPVPGLLVGGPNPSQQDSDKCPPYPSKLPALSYLDHVRSCASNEIAINWNAPAFYLAAGLCARETNLNFS